MKRIIGIASLFILSAASAFASETVSLESLQAAARENNAEIRVARERWEAAKARRTGSATPDSPRLSAEYERIPDGGIDVGQATETMYGVRQMIPFPAKLLARSKTARFEAEAAEARYRAVERSVLSRLRSVYADYYYAGKARATARQTADIMSNFARVAQARYATGGAAQSEVLRAQVEAERMNAMALTLERERETMRLELNLLVGRPAGEAIGEPEELRPARLDKGREELQAAAAAGNPEVKAAAAMASGSRWEERMARLEYLPDFDLAYKKRYMGGTEAGSDVMIEASIPLWFWKQGAGVRAASAERVAAEAERRNAELMAVTQAAEAHTKLESSWRLIDLYRTSVLPKAEQSLRSTQASYTAGKLEFLALLDSVRQYLDFNLEYHRLVADYQKDLARLEEVLGADIGGGTP